MKKIKNLVPVVIVIAFIIFLISIYYFSRPAKIVLKQSSQFPPSQNTTDKLIPEIPSNTKIHTYTNQSTTDNLSTFSSQYISPYPGQWPPIAGHSDTAYSCSKISRDVVGMSTILAGTQKNINGRNFCVYSFSDGGAGHFAGVYTYITAELGGNGTERADFRVDWSSCGGYGTTGDPRYDQCKNDQSTFFDNLDAYITSLM